jgi:sulfite exporter TauE/SafE/plastocyanin domain-containing protein
MLQLALLLTLLNHITTLTVGLSAFQDRFGLPDLSQLPPSAGLGLIFAAGLLTSFHCAGMCGGIALAQTAGLKADGIRLGFVARLKPTLPYHAGRILSYSAIGALAGGLGQVIRLPGVLKGAIPVFGGLFMIIMGINLLGLWKFLRRFNLRMPAFAARKLLSGVSRPGPLAVGLLGGLMPCGPLQIMQLYALASGSVWQGFISLLVFSLGTAPMLLLFSSIQAAAGKTFANAVTRLSAVIVIVLGTVMLTRGLALSGIAPLPSELAWNAAGTAVIGQDGKEQTVRISLDPNHKLSYPPIVVQKGIPVRWIISADNNALDLCNETVVVPAFGIERKLAAGDNIIRFAPGETGDFVYTCWMGMIKSRIQVVEDLAAYTRGNAKAAAPLASEAAATARAGGTAPSPAASLPPTPNREPTGSAPAQASTAAPVPAAETPSTVRILVQATQAPIAEATLVQASEATSAAPALARATEAPAAASSSVSPAPVSSSAPQDEPDPTVQTVITTVSPNSYSPVTVKRGLPVRWIIRATAEDLNECNNALAAPAFGLETKLSAGDTILEFTPSATGEFPFSCWMDMIKSTITVVE